MTWIETALKAGGVLTASMWREKIRVTMNWKGEEPISGEYHSDFGEALKSLDDALCDDAADEMCKKGKA